MMAKGGNKRKRDKVFLSNNWVSKLRFIMALRLNTDGKGQDTRLSSTASFNVGMAPRIAKSALWGGSSLLSILHN